MSLLNVKSALSKFHRRRRSVESYEWWNHLNYAQKFSVSSLYKFGYEINFVRMIDHNSIVIMSLNVKIVTVDKDGLIDSQPDILIRRN
ncbi:hypothetical protein GAB14E_2089 [Colwellia psychrerythraea]|uniref:Uncharacterized protein n=1 Tax=Colwellia psychrerythraea TaxID=28229 RepID=A0A099KXE4_COLPS|nr:hypothetical protein GAB14E_2089 [Colwellia psychrerythraea]